MTVHVVDCSDPKQALHLWVDRRGRQPCARCGQEVANTFRDTQHHLRTCPAVYPAPTPAPGYE